MQLSTPTQLQVVKLKTFLPGDAATNIVGQGVQRTVQLSTFFKIVLAGRSRWPDQDQLARFCGRPAGAISQKLLCTGPIVHCSNL